MISARGSGRATKCRYTIYCVNSAARRTNPIPGTSTIQTRHSDLAAHLTTIQSKGHESALCAACRPSIQTAPDLRGFTPPPTINDVVSYELLRIHPDRWI